MSSIILIFILFVSASVGRDTPLILTPYIESGKLVEGRGASRVTELGWNVTSHAGLLTVDKSCGSNMFFWYFPAEMESAQVPLLVWLNGISTASSYGIFLQNGPTDLLHSDEPTPRNASWQKYYHVIYIDNPVGVGFSYTESGCYSTTLDEVKKNLYNALEQFLKLFPDLSRRELYVAGVSLAGKYVTALAHKIYKEQKFNYKGMFLGDPLLDPSIQINYSPYLHQLGFIDSNEAGEIDKQERLIRRKIRLRQTQKAYKKINEFLLKDHSFILNITGLQSIYDYQFPYVNPQHYFKFITSKKVRDAVHVGSRTFDYGSKAMTYAAEICVEPMTSYLEDMIEDSKMLFYAGQFDLVCAYPMLIDVLSSLKWSGRTEYARAKREKLRETDYSFTWGYKKNYKTLTDVMIRNADHSALSQQPDRILNLLFNFTNYNFTKRF